METECSLPRLQQPATCFYPDPVHTPSYLLKTNFNITLPSMHRYFIFSLSSVSPPKNPVRNVHLCPIRATCSTYLIPVDLTTRILFDHEYWSWSSLLRTLLHRPSHLSLLEQTESLRNPSLMSAGLKTEVWSQDFPNTKLHIRLETLLQKAVAMLLYIPVDVHGHDVTARSCETDVLTASGRGPSRRRPLVCGPAVWQHFTNSRRRPLVCGSAVWQHFTNSFPAATPFQSLIFLNPLRFRWSLS